MFRSVSADRPVSLGLLGLFAAASSQAAVSGFDDLSLSPGSFLVGNPQPFPGGVTQFSSGFANYAHTAVDFGFGFTSWSGWAYSNVSDTTTAGFGNQYASFAGGGAAGTRNYVVAYAASPVSLSLATRTTLAGAYFSNTTYAALSMLHGDSFAKQFSLADADFFELHIEGLQGTAVTTTQTIALADYRADRALLLSTWLWVDLQGLGLVDGLRFSLRSSDVGAFGINTPLYFAMDELTAVPLPAAAWALLSALSSLPLATRRRRQLAQA